MMYVLAGLGVLVLFVVMVAGITMLTEEWLDREVK